MTICLWLQNNNKTGIGHMDQLSKVNNNYLQPLAWRPISGTYANGAYPDQVSLVSESPLFALRKFLFKWKK